MTAFLIETAHLKEPSFPEELLEKKKPLNPDLMEFLEIKPPIRSVDTYLKIMNGGYDD